MSVLQGPLYWASITNPNTTYEPVYSVNVIVDDATAADFKKRGFRIKDMDEGPAVVVKRKVNGPNGMIRNAPKLLDKDGNDVDTLIGNGSKVKVQFNPFDWEYAGNTGKSLDFQAIKILELVEYEGRVPDGAELSDGEEF